MGKDGGFLTPKAIANRIKAKGLQKLRWYCQMCQKQCRDENGFKCHQTSEAHLRQMALFRENPQMYMQQYSDEFEAGFMEILSRKRKRIKANNIYQEFIADRHHVHMNSTIWETLGNFVRYLGKSNQAVVDQDEEGNWWVTYVKRDPEVIARQQAIERRLKSEKDFEERADDVLAKQVESAMQQSGESKDERSPQEAAPVDLQNREQPIAISLAGARRPKRARDLPPVPVFEESSPAMPPAASSAAAAAANGTGDGAGDESAGAARKRKAGSAGVSNLDLLLQDIEMEKARRLAAEAQAKAAAAAASYSSSALGADKPAAASAAAAASSSGRSSSRKPYWLFPGIVVKVLNKELADGKLYKAKGTVAQVLDKYTAELKMADSGLVVRIDQDELETVIPKPGKEVLVVNGEGRGERGVLEAVDDKALTLDVRLATGAAAGQLLRGLAVKDVCKLA